MSHTPTHLDNRHYIIFDSSEINTIDFTQVLETSAETLRKSVDETKTFVKYEGAEIPTSVASLTSKEGPYSHEEILAILATEEWTDPNMEMV